MQPEIEESRYSHRRVIPEEDIEEFLMQFVVGVDSFIDSNFEIEG